MASLDDVVEEVLSRRHLELEGLSQAKAGSRTVLRITVDGDGPEGRGLTLDDVAEASREISQALDDSGAMGEKAYVLEVGTRGVDRPLTKPAQWRRNTGRLVKITGTEGEAVTARILGADDDAVHLSTGQTLPFAQVAKAVVQVEMKREEEKEEEPWTSM